MQATKQYVNNLSYKIVGCAIEVHKQLGPGLLESVYETCFVDELISQGLKVNRQVPVPIYYKGKDLGTNLILDLLISDLVIVELKAVKTIIPVFKSAVAFLFKINWKAKRFIDKFSLSKYKRSFNSFSYRRVFQTS
ncbi:MAG: GxxExxY protein [Ignavibacterium sp.]|nr:GxxExxY protein [Ignavibacterium sp.]